MAEPVGKPAGALQVLEEAAQLLRQTPFSRLVCHWTGSIPFALGLLFFWNTLSTVRLSDSGVAVQAFGLALLLAWMNCWRAVFAGGLRRQLSGDPDPKWTARRVGRLIAGQTFLGALKLVVLPLAALVTFPFANSVAFFRNAAALADRDDLDPLATIARARQLAGVNARQSWSVLPVLLFFYLLAALNIALTCAILPMLVRMLTGFESDFNRGESYFVQSPLFVMLVLVTAWAALDPFVQAVYCVRCFHAESVSTGEDLRVALRRIRAAMVAAMLLLSWIPLRAAVSPAELEQSVHQTMQSPEYGWRIPPPPPTGIAGRPWVLRVADKVLEALNSMWSAIGKGLGKLFEWVFGKLGVAPSGETGSAPVAGLHWSVYLLIAVVIGAAVAILLRWRASRRSATPAATGAATAAVRIDEENVSADQLAEERWREIALECLRQGQYRLALRAYYLANLAWLGQGGFVSIHAGKTNREYEQELRRKARPFAEARGMFGANVAAFEAAWYGMHEVTDAGIAEFRERLDSMKRSMA